MTTHPPLRLVTHNVNGIRACVRRGFAAWLADRSPDVVALQEVRAPADAVPDEAHQGYHWTYEPGEIAGRNGVALLTRVEPTAVRRGIGSREFDHEGRYVEADLDLGVGRALTVASVYVVKGGTPYEDEVSLQRHHRKMRFCSALGRQIEKSRKAAQREGREFVVMGDWNVAPDEVDVAKAKTKHKMEGFLPVEREWLKSLLGPRRLHDVVRALHPDAQGPYSWWSWRGQAWTVDSGWRIDHQLATPTLARAAVSGGTDREPTYEERMSDHSPVLVDYHW